MLCCFFIVMITQPHRSTRTDTRLPDVTLCLADRWFWHHSGVNPLSQLRATSQMLHSGQVVSGGSTLTMQVARILETDPEASARTPCGKARQILRALQLEAQIGRAHV